MNQLHASIWQTGKIVFVFCLCLYADSHTFAQTTARGVVFLDANRNGIKDPDEKPLAEVCVSNGKEVAATNGAGQWELPAGDDTGFFVIKPAAYALPLNAHLIPQHYYLHKPKGSPPSPSEGVAPTGPLPASIDFPLWEPEETVSDDHRFQTLFFGDTQARGLEQVNYITHDVVEECIGTEAAFGVTLGDIVADDPNLFAEISGSIAQIGVPWYNVFGNHDNNRGATSNQYADETFERYFGPSTYAFEYGKVVFIALNNIYSKPKGGFKPRFTSDQIDFVRNYLQHVPEEKLVVLLMHAPITTCGNRRALFEVIEKRPHTFSIASHFHELSHLFLDRGNGWQGKNPHHHFINGAVSGSWWAGLKDEQGIPNATMYDGTPNGYAVITFAGNTYDIRYKVARRPADYQMNIYLPEDIPQQEVKKTEVLVNVFAGSARSTVQMQFDRQGKWYPLRPTKTVDPQILRMHKLSAYLETTVDGQPLDQVLGGKMGRPSKTQHLWVAKIPDFLTPGTHLVTVRTTDMFGNEWTAHRIFRVR